MQLIWNLIAITVIAGALTLLIYGPRDNSDDAPAEHPLGWLRFFIGMFVLIGILWGTFLLIMTWADKL